MRSHIAGLTVIASAVLIAYLPPLLQGKVYYSEDTSDINYMMMRSHVMDLMLQREFNAWTPAIGTGHYRAADPTYAIWSPIRLLVFLLVPGYNAQLAVIFIYAFLAGIGAYLAGLVLTKSRLAATYLGVAFPLSGPFMSMAGNIPYFASAAWYGLIIAAWFGVSSLRRRIALSGAALAMVAVDGDLIGMGVSGAEIFALSLLSPREPSRSREAAASLGAIIFSILLSAAVWLPALEVLSESRRASGLDIAESLTFSLHPIELITLFAPRFLGQVHDHTFWAQDFTNSLMGNSFWFQHLYLGLLTPLLLLAAVAKKEGGRKQAVVFLPLAAFLLLLALGKNFPLLPALLEIIPPLKLLRYPSKFFLPASFLLLLASGLGLGKMEKTFSGPQFSRAYPAIAFAVPFIELALCYLIFSRFILELQSTDPMSPGILRLALFALAAPLAVILTARFGRSRPRLLSLLILGLTLIDFTTARPVLQTNPAKGMLNAPAFHEGIAIDGGGRVIIDEDMFRYLTISPRESGRYNWGIDLLEYSFGASATLFARIYDLENAKTLAETDGAAFRVLAADYIVSSLEPRADWIKYLSAKGRIKLLQSYPMENLALFEVTGHTWRFFCVDSVQVVGDRDTALKQTLTAGSRETVMVPIDQVIWKGKRIKPRPEMIPASGTGAPVDFRLSDFPEYGNDRQKFRLELKHPAWFIERDYLMPGWRAEVDGKEAPIYFADGIGRAVYLGAGKHEVIFKFEPRGLKWGMVFSALGLLSLAAALPGRGQRNKEGEEVL